MNKLKVAFLLTSLSLASTNSFAGEQTVKLCLNVQNDLESQSFIGKFVSTDVYDVDKYTGHIQDGVSCVWHTYSSGPQNIKLNFYAEKSPYKVKFNLNNCSYLHSVDQDWLASGVLRSEASAITYNVSIKKTPGQGSFKSYTVSCTQSTS